MAPPEHEPHCTNGNSNINSRYYRFEVRHYYSTFRCLARCNGNRPCWRRRIRRGPYGSCTGEHALRSDRERGGRIRPFRHNGEFDCLGTFCRSAYYWTATVGTCRGVVDTTFIQLLKVVLPHAHIHTHTHARHATPRNVILRLFQLLTVVLYIYIYIPHTAPRHARATAHLNAMHCRQRTVIEGMKSFSGMGNIYSSTRVAAHLPCLGLHTIQSRTWTTAQ